MAAFVVGLTGGIASGKSAVAAALVQLGATLVDTDVIAREVVEPGSEGLAAVCARFGPDVLTADGSLDRAALRRRVFEDAPARQSLEAILHPRIRAVAAAQVGAAAGPYVVLAVPLLVESAQYDWVQRVLVVDCDPASQRARLQARDGISVDLADRMLAAQADRPARLACADEVIRNTGSLDALQRQARCCHRRYLTLAAQ
ncbi:MAG: dephospho-CoA kinase [Lysobacterales bacterium]